MAPVLTVQMPCDPNQPNRVKVDTFSEGSHKGAWETSIAVKRQVQRLKPNDYSWDAHGQRPHAMLVSEHKRAAVGPDCMKPERTAALVLCTEVLATPTKSPKSQPCSPVDRN